MKIVWDLFRDWAARTDADGRRVIVPVLGTGFNAQAGAKKDWGDLLRDVQRAVKVHVDLPEGAGLVGNTTLAWEAMVLALSHARNRKPSEVEDELLEVAADLLDKSYPPEGPTAAFAEAFLSHRFRDVMSFNFDRVLHVEGARWRHAARTFSKTRSHLAREDGTRLWHPHGATKWPRSLRLGMRNYGTYLKELEDARSAYKDEEEGLKRRLLPELFVGGRQRRASTAPQRDRLWAAHREVASSWLTVAMNAPLVMIGLGMGREEWPLWWFLNQRARNHARRDIERPVFVFMRRPEAESFRVACELANVQLLTFETFPAGWDRLLGVLDATRPRAAAPRRSVPAKKTQVAR
jgi:hypothetical protein